MHSMRPKKIFSKQNLKHFFGIKSPPLPSSKPTYIPENIQSTPLSPLEEPKPKIEKDEDSFPIKASVSKTLDPKKEFLRLFNSLTGRYSSWEVWKDMVVLFSCSFSNAVDKKHFDIREELYLKTISKYNKKEVDVFPQLLGELVLSLEKNPRQDFLGNVFMSLGLGTNSKGQFFTPYSVCELMARITIGDDVVEQGKSKGYISINDPCCGAGATLIAGIHAAADQLEEAGINWQNHIFVVAQDVDLTVALMCYIQLSLLGVAGYVKVGNSLTEPTTVGGSMENCWYTLLYFSETWRVRRIMDSMIRYEKVINTRKEDDNG